jgi:hypothetical protein
MIKIHLLSKNKLLLTSAFLYFLPFNVKGKNRFLSLIMLKGGGEGTPRGLVKEPETPEDEQGEKFHLFHSFQRRMTLRWFSSLLSLPLQHILIEEGILHANGIDDAVDDH